PLFRSDRPRTPAAPRPRRRRDSDAGTPAPAVGAAFRAFGTPCPAFGVLCPAVQAAETKEGEDHDRGQGRGDRDGQVRVTAELGDDVAGETDPAGGEEGRKTVEEAT